MAFLALFFRESCKQKCLHPNSGVYSIETSGGRRKFTGRIMEKVKLLVQTMQGRDEVLVVESYSATTGNCCVMEAPHKDVLASWFTKMKMPCDYSTSVDADYEVP